ncbi:hypothetical protein BN1708_000245 [Verticillium longisporum]|uniref:Uncharacterized protein n=1 Tax=Verticillium longisporum TaxID=100787 RepID=A0A0G4KCJ2_VERLO|nr:hypothetical protein BN1708_000245 [Verticillium longisporum]
MPSQPMAKKVLKMKRKTMPVIWKAVPSWELTPVRMAMVAAWELTPVRMAMVAAWPAAPKSMSLRRPTRSTSQMGGSEARKYSVPLRAARRRDMNGDMPSCFLVNIRSLLDGRKFVLNKLVIHGKIGQR